MLLNHCKQQLKNSEETTIFLCVYFISQNLLYTLYFSDGSTSDTSASVIQAIPFQARNYYKSVSENKEIVKLVSVLSTSITSTKKVYAPFSLQEYFIKAYNMSRNKLKRYV